MKVSVVGFDFVCLNNTTRSGVIKQNKQQPLPSIIHPSSIHSIRFLPFAAPPRDRRPAPMPLLKDIPASDPPIEENPSDELLTGEAAGRFDEVWESAEGGGDAARGGRGRGGSPRRPRPEVSPRRSPGWRRSPRRGPRGPRPEDGLPGSALAPALALAAEEQEEQEEEQEKEQKQEQEGAGEEGRAGGAG